MQETPNQIDVLQCLYWTECWSQLGHANLLPVALAAERRTVILTDSHEFATARLA